MSLRSRVRGQQKAGRREREAESGKGREVKKERWREREECVDVLF